MPSSEAAFVRFSGSSTPCVGTWKKLATVSSRVVRVLGIGGISWPPMTIRPLGSVLPPGGLPSAVGATHDDCSVSKSCRARAAGRAPSTFRPHRRPARAIGVQRPGRRTAPLLQPAAVVSGSRPATRPGWRAFSSRCSAPPTPRPWSLCPSTSRRRRPARATGGRQRCLTSTPSRRHRRTDPPPMHWALTSSALVTTANRARVPSPHTMRAR